MLAILYTNDPDILTCEEASRQEVEQAEQLRILVAFKSFHLPTTPAHSRKRMDIDNIVLMFLLEQDMAE